MTDDKEIGIIFQKTQIGIVPSLALDDLNKTSKDVNTLLEEAVKIYNYATSCMKIILNENRKLRKENKKVPARLMWDLGDSIFKMVNDLKEKDLILENLYENLTRDINTSPSTIKRVIALRRCIEDRDLIPEDLNWGLIKDSPRKIYEKLLQWKKE
jgi:hypothetical protein